jgi:hypothetical protein
VLERGRCRKIETDLELFAQQLKLGKGGGGKIE